MRLILIFLFIPLIALSGIPRGPITPEDILRCWNEDEEAIQSCLETEFSTQVDVEVLVSADLDRDGVMERILTARMWGYLFDVFLMSDSTAVFLSVHDHPFVQILDLDFDGRKEFFVYSLSGSGRFLSGEVYSWNRGRLRRLAEIPCAYHGRFSFRDVNDDGKLDLVVDYDHMTGYPIPECNVCDHLHFQSAYVNFGDEFEEVVFKIVRDEYYTVKYFLRALILKDVNDLDLLVDYEALGIESAEELLSKLRKIRWFIDEISSDLYVSFSSDGNGKTSTAKLGGYGGGKEIIFKMKKELGVWRIRALNFKENGRSIFKIGEW